MSSTWINNFQQVGSSGAVPGAPCSQWRLQYTSFVPLYTIDPYLDVQNLKLKWDLQVRAPSGAVVWEQLVELQVLAITGGGGLLGYVYLYNQSATKISTTYEDGSVVVQQGDAIPVADWQVLAETPSWGLGPTGLWGRWQGAIETQPLPGGATFHVVFHNVGLPGLTSAYAPLAVAAKTGAVWTALRSPELGMIFVAQAGANGITVTGAGDVRALDAGASGEQAFPWAPGSAALPAALTGVVPASSPARPVLLRYPSRKTAFLLLWQEGQGVRAAYSSGSGAALTWSDPLVILTGYSPLGACMAPDGSGVVVLARGPEGIVGVRAQMDYSGAGVTLEAGRPWALKMTDGTDFPSIPDQLHQLVLQGGRAWLLVSAGGSTEIYSSQDLVTWAR